VQPISFFRGAPLPAPSLADIMTRISELNHSINKWLVFASTAMTSVYVSQLPTRRVLQSDQTDSFAHNTILQNALKGVPLAFLLALRWMCQNEQMASTIRFAAQNCLGSGSKVPLAMSKMMILVELSQSPVFATAQADPLSVFQSTLSIITCPIRRFFACLHRKANFYDSTLDASLAMIFLYARLRSTLISLLYS